MRDRSTFPDPQKQHAQCPFRAFVAQKPLANAPHASHRAGGFASDEIVDDFENGWTTAPKGTPPRFASAASAGKREALRRTRVCARFGTERSAGRGKKVSHDAKGSPRFSRLGCRAHGARGMTRGAARKTRSRGAGARTCENGAAWSSDPKTVWPSMKRAFAVDDASFFGGVPFGPIERPKTGAWCVGIHPSVIAR